MQLFNVLFEEDEIGRTLFEGRDPPMGIVEGEFIPSPIYSSHRNMIVGLLCGPQDHLKLAIIASDGQRIDTRFIRIDDDGEDIRHVTAMLNNADQWSRYFPDH